MSFGYSIGDFVSLAQLAWTVVNNTRMACGEHDELAREVNNLRIVLQRLSEEVSKPDSLLNVDKDDQVDELRNIARNCRRLLRALGKQLDKYNALTGKKRSFAKLWQQVRFGNGMMKNLSDVRLKVSSYTSALTLHISLLSIGSQGRVERHMYAQGGELGEMRHSINWIRAELQASHTEGPEGDLSGEANGAKDKGKSRESTKDTPSSTSQEAPSHKLASGSTVNNCDTRAETDIKDLDHNTRKTMVSESTCNNPIPMTAIVEENPNAGFFEAAHPNCEMRSAPSLDINDEKDKLIPRDKGKGKEVPESPPDAAEIEPQRDTGRDTAPSKSDKTDNEPDAEEAAVSRKATYSEIDQAAPEHASARNLKIRLPLPRVVVIQAEQTKDTERRENTSGATNDLNLESSNLNTKLVDLHSDEPRARSETRDSADCHLRPPRSPEVATTVVGNTSRRTRTMYYRNIRRPGPVYYHGSRRMRSVSQPSRRRTGAIYYAGTRIPRAIWRPRSSFVDEASDEEDWVDDPDDPCIIEASYTNECELEAEFSRPCSRLGSSPRAATIVVDVNRRGRCYYRPISRSFHSRSRGDRRKSAQRRIARSRSESTSTVYVYRRTIYCRRRQTRPIYEYDGGIGTRYYAHTRPRALCRVSGYQRAGTQHFVRRSFSARRRIIRTTTSITW